MLLAVVVVVVVGGDCYCAACIHFGALFSRQRSFFLYCDMYLRFRACAVVLDIELSVRAWCQKTRHALYCCARGVFCCCCFLEQTAESGSVRCAVCGISFKITYIMERKQKKDFSPIRTRKNPAASNIHPHQKAIFYLWKLPMWTCELDPHER